MLSHLSMNLSLLPWAVCVLSWQPLALSNWWKGILHIWTLSAFPAALESWIWEGNWLLLDHAPWFLTFADMRCRHPIPAVCLPLRDPKPEVGLGGLELHSCCSSSFSDVFLFCTLAALIRAGWPWEVDSYQSFSVWCGNRYRLHLLKRWNLYASSCRLMKCQGAAVGPALLQVLSWWRLLEQLKLHPHLDCTHLCCSAYQSILISTQPCTLLSDKLLKELLCDDNLEGAVRGGRGLFSLLSLQ